MAKTKNKAKQITTTITVYLLIVFVFLFLCFIGILNGPLNAALKSIDKLFFLS